MPIPTPKVTAPPRIERKSVKNWLDGVVTNVDVGRGSLNGLTGAGNVLLDQDGVVKPRPSKVLFGPQPLGTVLGQIYEFKNVTGLTSTNWMISLQNVSGTTKVYIAKGEDTTWTVCNGKTYDNTASARFVQIGAKVLVMNGTDNLSYLDIPTSTIIPYTALTTPTSPTIANNGSTSLVTGTTPLNVYYAITANSTVGETIGSASTSIAVNTDRDLWNPSTQSLKVSWTAVTNAKSYNLYMAISAPGGSPTLYLIKSNIDAGTLTYIDDGSLPQDTTRPIPTVDSTAGPKVTRGEVINGRVFLVGDKDNPYYVRYGGDFGFELDFSPANGGGFTPINNGGKELPNAIKSFRDGKGTQQITVLCRGTNGKGKRFLMSPDSLTLGSTVISFFSVTEDYGEDGTDSPDGLISYQDDLHYPSRDGFKSTGTLPQLQNVLSTRRTSNTIQPDIKNLNTSSMSKCVGLAFEGRLYWAVPVSSTSNNEMWVLDLDRKGAWMKPWSISIDWMWLYNDNSGVTHHLVLSSNGIFELSYASLTNDNGTAFSTNGNSSQIYFSDDGREWGKVIQLVFVLLRPQGTINFTVSGRTEDSTLSVVGTGSYSAVSARAGWSEPKMGWSDSTFGKLRGWSEINTVPVQFNDAVQEVVVEVDEELQWYTYGWTTSDPGVGYALSDVVSEYVRVGMKDLT
jgi:hypothetical protein